MDLNEKIEVFKKAGIENMLIVTDFDGTLTRGYRDNGSRASLISVLREEDFLSKDYQTQAQALFSKYHPIEIDPSISDKSKKITMKRWWSEHFELLAKSGIDKAIVEQIGKDDKLLCLREGVNEFFNLQKQNNVATLVFSSSGIGDVIEIYLNNADQLNKDLHLIYSPWKYDNEGRFIGIKGSIVHCMNKGVDVLKDTSSYDKYKDSQNILLVGDSLSDVNMVEGFDYDNIIKVGYFNLKLNSNSSVCEREKYDILKNKYYDAFDLVIEGDGDMNRVNDLIKRII